MVKITDLQAIKKIAKNFLYLPIRNTMFSPSIVQHPFTDTGIILIINEKEFTHYNITEDTDGLNTWIKQQENLIDEAKTAIEIYLQITKPYIFVFLKHIKEYLDIKDFSEILGDCWTRVEYSNMDVNLKPLELITYFKQCDKSILMDEDEFNTYNSFPDVVTVYRGVTTYNDKNIKVLSWTTNVETAEWFAKRYDEKGIIYSATIKKENILAFFGGRSEFEVIVEPKYLQNIKRYKDLSKE